MFAVWSREVAGWVLVVIGLCAFGLAALMLLGLRVIESGPLVAIGFVIFRGGIHLLKVAVAARLCQPLADRPTKRA